MNKGNELAAAILLLKLSVSGLAPALALCLKTNWLAVFGGERKILSLVVFTCWFDAILLDIGIVADPTP